MFDLMRQRPVCSTKKAFEMVCAGGGECSQYHLALECEPFFTARV